MMPTGVAFRDGALYVVDIGQILKYENAETSLDTMPEAKVVYDDMLALPHGWKYLTFDKKGRKSPVMQPLATLKEDDICNLAAYFAAPGWHCQGRRRPGRGRAQGGAGLALALAKERGYSRRMTPRSCPVKFRPRRAGGTSQYPRRPLTTLRFL